MQTADKKMDFVIGDSRYCQLNTADGHFYITEDTSLLYNDLHGDYSVLLGGNWRFELLVDSLTGLCTQVQSFLDKLEVTHTTLELPRSECKDLYFVREEPLEPGCGCHYFPFSNKAYWDSQKKILCFGDPKSNGEAAEFASKIVAVVDNKRLVCMYLLLDNMNGEIAF